MRRFLYFFLCMTFLPLSASRISKDYTFRFNDPQSLNPPITKSPDPGGAIPVTDIVFSTDDGNVNLSFIKGSSVIGAEIITDTKEAGYTPYLTFNTLVSMVISVNNPESAQIVKVESPSWDALGGVYLYDISPRPENPTDFKRDGSVYRWTGTASSLTFYNGGQSPTFHTITVYYEVEALDLFTISSISPAVGVVSGLSDVVLTFPSEVGKVDGSKVVTLTGKGGDVINGHASKDGSNTVKITFDKEVSTPDIYTLRIPEGIVYDAADKFYNPVASYIYNVGDVASDELRQTAQQLLAYSGIGYPTENSAARIALAGLTANSSTTDYNTAIANYLTTTEVELPVTNHYYKIHAQSVNGQHYYLKYDGTTISLSTQASDAACLMATGREGSFSFMTTDNKFIVLPGSSSTSISDAYSTDNNITLAKYPAGSNPRATFGLLSLSTSGKYAGINCINNTLALPVSDPEFSAQMTCAFSMEQASDSEIPVPDIPCSIDPADGSQIEMFNEVKVTFEPLAGTSISVANPSLITLTGSGQTYTPQAVTPSGANQFVIKFNDVKAGTYTLTIGRGAFTYPYTINGNPISASVQQLTYHYTVKASDDFQYDLRSKYDIYVRDSHAADEPVKDTELNRLAFYTYDTEFGADPTKVVRLLYYNTSKEYRTGHFEVTTDPSLPDASVVELILDTPITTGSIPSGLYVFDIPAASYGDSNFKRYLNGEAIAKHDCHVTSANVIYMTVNNNYVPDPEKPKPSAEVMAKAREVLSKKGVGYPANNASSRTTLESLVSGGVGTDAEFNAAIQAVYAETNVQLPTAGKFYSITAVTANNGPKAYVQDAATLSADASKAGAFKAGVSGSAITFENKNGKFLTVLTAAGSLTDAFSAADNNLTLARYPVSGNNAEATFGLITISGNKGGTTMMSQVNVSNMAITTSGNTAVFTNEATSAFCFADTSEPTPDPVPDAQYTLSPASGSQVSGTKLDVTLTFKGITNVTVADRTKIKLVHGEQVVQATSVTAQQENTQFAIVFNGLATGTYTLQIEKGAFTYPYNGKTAAVQAITATYDMTEKTVPSQEVLAKAEALLAKTGVGYPAADSPARLALKKLVDAKAGTNNEFNAAIDAYLADINIEKPANGKYYRMVTRSKAFQSYFALDGSKLKLQADAEGAAVFKATANADGTTTLMAVNDKYLSLPTATSDYLSFNYDKAAHDLTLSRLNVSGVSNEETFGLISMSLGGKYAVMTLDETTATVQEPRSNATYGSYQTSALKFEEASELEITMPDVDYTVTPGANTQVESMEKITIVFANRNEVKLKDASKIKLLDAITDKVYLPKSVTKVEGTQNTFDMTFINLPARAYNLNIAKGAFVVNFLGREEPVQEIVVKYITVTKEPELAKDFDTYYNLRWVDRGYAYVTDVSLNNFRLKANTAIELINNAPQVKITTWSNYDVRATGHFEKTADSNVVLLVLDKEIKEGDLKAGEYNVHIEEKTLCDANYIQYLADNSSVSLSSCHVNPKVKFTVNVDNEKAAQGIEELLAADSEKYPVYDLMGRKVDGPLVPGKVYLCNGKKYVVKK